MATTGDLFDDNNNTETEKAVGKTGRPSRRKLNLVTERENELINLSCEIADAPASRLGQLGYMATSCVFASMPYNQVVDQEGKNSSYFKRSTGNVNLTIMNDPEIGLPYGKLPRLITAFLCTQGKIQGQEIYLGRNQKEFAEKLGQKCTGGENGSMTRIKDQAKRLFTSHISLTSNDKSTHQFGWRNINLTDSGYLLWDPMNPEEKGTWKNTLILSEPFYNDVKEHSIPIDLRVFNALRSAMAIDIYMWLTYRYNAVRKPTLVTWMQLKFQFGVEYTNDERGMRNFRAKFRENLTAVHNIWRDARFDIGEKGLLLLESKPHIAGQIAKGKTKA